MYFYYVKAQVSVEQVVIPDWVAKRMTFPERVCDANKARLQGAITRGPEKHPGACASVLSTRLQQESI